MRCVPRQYRLRHQRLLLPRRRDLANTGREPAIARLRKELQTTNGRRPAYLLLPKRLLPVVGQRTGSTSEAVPIVAPSVVIVVEVH